MDVEFTNIVFVCKMVKGIHNTLGLREVSMDGISSLHGMLY